MEKQRTLGNTVVEPQFNSHSVPALNRLVSAPTTPLRPSWWSAQTSAYQLTLKFLSTCLFWADGFLFVPYKERQHGLLPFSFLRTGHLGATSCKHAMREVKGREEGTGSTVVVRPQ